MINEGLLTEALVTLRSIHDRYDARKRNPWNEIEGAEHYSRAMHPWNVLLTLSGYTHDGPAGKIGFAPKITPENFKSFFSLVISAGGRLEIEVREDSFLRALCGSVRSSFTI